MNFLYYVFLTDCEFDVCGSRHCPPKGFDIGVETVKHGDVECKCIICIKKPTKSPW